MEAICCRFPGNLLFFLKSLPERNGFLPNWGPSPASYAYDSYEYLSIITASCFTSVIYFIISCLATGIILRCDVFVDTINRIEIATTTRELLLGETPEVFDVYGYDEEGIFIYV